MFEPYDTVEALAAALDNDDYTTVLSLLSDDVTYELGNRTLRGPEAVAASYRESSEMARRIFDSVEYGHSHPRTTDGHTFGIAYTDTLTIDDETLIHNAHQTVTVDRTKGVTHITNEEVPGESAKVEEFLERHGRSRT